MKLHSERVEEAKKYFANHPLEQLSDEMYEYFFEYFCSTGEMPYGVAKARTGDPYNWIINRIFEK